MKALFLALLATLAIGAAACGGALGLDAIGGSGESSSSAPAPLPGAAGSTNQTSASTAPSCPNGSLEGCFGYNQMSSFLGTVNPMVEQYFKAEFPKVSLPREVVYVPTGRQVAGTCGPSDSQAYEYCPANRTIYIGQDSLWTFYRRAGDAAPVMALAHEWGHHVQVMKGIDSGRTPAQSVQFENQADCLAGAFIQYAGKQGWLEKDDIQDIDGLLAAIGSRESRVRDHGTASERRQSFELGFKNGATGCNSFFPKMPVA